MKQIFTLFSGLFIYAISSAQQITEIHYDNTGTDANERIEVTLPIGTAIASWNVVLYNGSTNPLASLSYSTTALTLFTKTTEGLFDIYVFSYPANGIQNGANDGVALVNGATVVEFLSYEGAITALDGPAAGLPATDILVSEPGTGLSTGSIQRNSSSGAWIVDPGSNSFGALNTLLLPVKIVSFEAINKKTYIVISWTVAQENGISSYQLEKSSNGIDFQMIGAVLPQNISYSFQDNQPIAGNNYYRLKIKENNGTESYSFIQKVKINGQDLCIQTIYPSPAKEWINVKINNHLDAVAQIAILDRNGKPVFTSKAPIVNGVMTKQCNIQTLASGIYFVNVTVGNETVTEKFIKQ